MDDHTPEDFALPVVQNGGLRRAATLTRSGARRYHREFMQALRGRGPARDVMALDTASARGTLSAAWLGHASVLLRIGHAWVLTDPVLTHRIGVRLGPITLGVPRLLPAADLASLPPIDLILVSHAHFDHLDKPTLRRLVSPTTHVVTAAGTADLIPRGYGSVIELPWGEAREVAGLEVRALRPEHWGARTALDRRRGFNAYTLAGPAGRVLFAGDTAETAAFSRLRGVDLSLFGVGAYNPWVHAHATPEQAWAMHESAGGRFFLPMHHSTFKLSDEPLHEPMQRLLGVAGLRGPSIVGRTLGRFWNRDDTVLPR